MLIALINFPRKAHPTSLIQLRIKLNLFFKNTLSAKAAGLTET
jgi:hypothetical protein